MCYRDWPRASAPLRVLYFFGMIYELPLVREAYGFGRTTCGCPLCQAPCRHLPGALDPADLSRLCPPGHDLLPWAEQHLRAMVDKPYPTLVPARRESGYCHWYVGGACAVHPAAPFGWRYGSVTRLAPPATVSPLAFPAGRVAVATLLP